jgi:hypothetical protein
MKKDYIDKTNEHRKKILEMLHKLFVEYYDEEKPGDSKDFAFHMADWVNDLEDLHSLYGNPSKYTDKEQFQIVHSFVSHAGSHIKEAIKIMGDIDNPFEQD